MLVLCVYANRTYVLAEAGEVMSENVEQTHRSTSTAARQPAQRDVGWDGRETGDLTSATWQAQPSEGRVLESGTRWAQGGPWTTAGLGESDKKRTCGVVPRKDRYQGSSSANANTSGCRENSYDGGDEEWCGRELRGSKPRQRSTTALQHAYACHGNYG